MPAIAALRIRGHYLKNDLSEVRTLKLYGFLYAGYKFSAYYWELVILFRKVCILFVLVYLGLVNVEI